MTARLLFMGLLASVSLFGQLQLWVVDKWFERAVEGQYDLGAVPTGETLDTMFRLKNPGTAPVTLTALSVGGTGFSLLSGPAPGSKIAPGGAADFVVRFRPAMASMFSASLQSDGVSVILRATGVAALSIFLEQKDGRLALSSGSTAGFATTERGASATLRFRLENQTRQVLTLNTLNVGGAFFRLAAGPPPGTVFAPGDSAPFEIAFDPRQSGVWQGSLQVEQRQIVLVGTALEPAPPAAELSLELDPPASARQGKLSIKLAAASRTAVAGIVQMEFRPDAGLRDPTVVFANGGRSAAFSIVEGDTAARFGALAYVQFQTGTTAGTIVFTLQFGGAASQAAVTIPPAPAGLEKPGASRNGSNLEVRLTGFDNTHSASRIAFTFFDRDGNAIGGGPIRVDQTENFRGFFESSDLGGLFALRAVFPVTGPPEQIDAVEVELTSSGGSTKTERVRF